MKKISLIVVLMAVLIILSLVLTSCNFRNLGGSNRIIAPNNNLPPLQGKWIVEKVIDSPYKKLDLEEREDFIDKEALFHKDAVVVGDQYIREPSYKIRKVNLSDYLLYNFKTDSHYLEIEEKEGEIISILGDNQYFREFIKYSEEEMIIFADERFFFLKRSIKEISKEEIDRYIDIERNILRTTSSQELKSLNTGLLLGIKTYNHDEVNNLEDWDYKTLWIKANSRLLGPIYEVKDLLVPRKKGFWTIEVKRENVNGNFRDKINSYSRVQFKEDLKLETAAFLERSINPSILKNILYIGNDYISTEVIDKGNNMKRLEVYPIDSVEKGNPIRFSDISEEHGLQYFNDGGQELLKGSGELVLNEKSFGLLRRNGYWIMKGRINYIMDGEELYKDYNIRTIPPKEIVNYDDLYIPWNIIKARFPNAIDAFTSPNEDIIIIETRNKILIYGVQDGEILEQELGSVGKDYNDKIIMAEWSTDRYTNLWEEEILKIKVSQ